MFRKAKLDFGGRGKKRDQGWCHLPDEPLVEIFARQVVHEDHDHLSLRQSRTHRQEELVSENIP